MTTPPTPLYLEQPISQVESLRICKKCLISQPLTNFHKNAQVKDGYANRCKSCVAIYLHEWEIKKKEKLARREKRDSNPMRKCSSCKLIQTIDNFGSNTRGRDGLYSMCYACRCLKENEKRQSIKGVPRPDIDENSAFKVCNKCHILQPLLNFYKSLTTLTGYSARCKSCLNIDGLVSKGKDPEYQQIRNSIYYQENKDKERLDHKEWISKHPGYYKEGAKDYNFRRFGVDRDWYIFTLATQNGGCAICGSTIPGGSGRFHVDHDHSCCGSRKACDKCRRGLLCSSCNLLLGHLENEKWKRQAMAYLNKYRKDGKKFDEAQGSLFDI